MQSFSKIVCPGASKCGKLFVRISWDGSRLSIVGVEGPHVSGNANGSSGQCVEAIGRLTEYFTGWDKSIANELASVWDRWHLNDMRAGCKHQRKSWNLMEAIEVVEYRLTPEARKLQREALSECSRAGVAGTVPQLSAAGGALVDLDMNYREVYEAPDADSPLSGCFEPGKRETKAACWVYPHQHPRGLLCKPCEVCRHKYGSKWLREDVPSDVLEWLHGLPESSFACPWRNL